MGTVQKSVRLPEDLVGTVRAWAGERGAAFSEVLRELLEEAIKMRRCPGIVFGDGPSGRRARIAGTGIEVWEVIAAYKSVGEDFGRLRAAYHWLSEAQLRAALGYYAAYPQEVDRLIERNAAWTPERLRAEYPGLVARPDR